MWPSGHSPCSVASLISARLPNVLVTTRRELGRVSPLETPYTPSRGGPEPSARFYLADCLEVFRQLPPHSVDVIVTSPPYNLGIRYSRYQDTLSQADYLEWTNTWIAAAARVLRPDGSLFLNVGAKPSDPWTALDVAQAARSHLRLQNIIHWVKSIAIDRASAGAGRGADARPRGRPLQADQQRPLPERLPRVRLPLHAARRRPTSIGWRSACRIRISRTSPAGAAAAEGVRCRGNTWFIPYETIQRRDRDRPHPATFPSRLPEQCLRLHGLVAHRAGDGSVHRPGQHGGRLRAARRRTSSAPTSTRRIWQRRSTRTRDGGAGRRHGAAPLSGGAEIARRVANDQPEQLDRLLSSSTTPAAAAA